MLLWSQAYHDDRESVVVECCACDPRSQALFLSFLQSVDPRRFVFYLLSPYALNVLRFYVQKKGEKNNVQIHSKRIVERAIWKKEEIVDYAGRVMMKSACGNRNSRYEPTIDHVRPLSKGGRDVKENLVICHWETNAEKGDKFPHWQANGKRLKAIKVKGSTNGYEVVDDLQKEKKQ